MNLQDKIEVQLHAFLHADTDPGTATENAAVIVALVRDALLSDAAVEAGAWAITNDPNFGTNRWTDDARNVIRGALDAALGTKATA